MIRKAGSWIRGAACIVRMRMAIPAAKRSAAMFTSVIRRMIPDTSAGLGLIDAPVASASTVTITQTIAARTSAASA